MLGSWTGGPEATLSIRFERRGSKVREQAVLTVLHAAELAR